MKEKDTKVLEEEKKEVSRQISKKIFVNVLTAAGLMLYFIVLNLAYNTIQPNRFDLDLKVFSGIFLFIGILVIEKAYKQDSGIKAISGIEFIVMSLHSLSIMHVITVTKYDFRIYLLVSSYVFAIYYILKSIVIYTKERKKYLNSLSDISEIVKKDEPIIKEASKKDKNNNKVEKNIDTKNKTKKEGKK